MAKKEVKDEQKKDIQSQYEHSEKTLKKIKEPGLDYPWGYC